MYKRGELRSYEDKVYYADSTLFSIFTYEFLEGNAKNALVEPKSMVLTESLAKKYFGKTTGVVGQSIQNAGGDIFKITGVIRDVPFNSHIRFNMLISASTLPKDFANTWGSFGFFTYVLLRPDTDPVAFEKKLLPMYDKYMASHLYDSSISRSIMGYSPSRPFTCIRTSRVSRKNLAASPISIFFPRSPCS